MNIRLFILSFCR